MRMSNTNRPARRMEAVFCVLVMCLTAFGAAPAWAQDQTEAERRRELLGDFVHFVLIDRPDIASATGEQLLSSGIDGPAFVDLVEVMQRETGTDFFDILGRAGRRVELEPLAGRLRLLYDRGRLDRARNADEIARNIADLTGSARQIKFARDRLQEAGEYAMPQLLDALLRGDNPILSARVQRLMIDMSKHSVTPLSQALSTLEETEQERVADILGQLGYPAAGPALIELAAQTENENVRWAAEQAIGQLNLDAGMSPSEAYFMLGEAYYEHRDQLTSFPGEGVQLMWSHSPETGLVPTAIATEVYHEAMTMRHAAKSLTLEPNAIRSLALWIAANFSREIDTQPGYANPAYPDTMREALYYAVAAGPVIGEIVLSRALDDRDTALALRAIESVSRTANSGSLLELDGAQSPLVRALTYPNRRVQYEAALALGGSNPDRSFAGSERVVPILAGAIRFAGIRYAAIATDDREQYQARRATLEDAGFLVLPFTENDSDLEVEIAGVPGVDFVLIEHDPDAARAAFELLRGFSATSAAPALIITDNDGVDQIRRENKGDETVLVRLKGIGGDQVSAAVDSVMNRAVGGVMEQSEAVEYARQSVLTLRDLAVSQNSVLPINDASVSLIAAMDETEGDMRLAVADVLARIAEPRAQQAVVQGAIDASGDERIELLHRSAASARQFGNLLEQSHVTALLEIAGTGVDDEATPAAAVLGALRVPNSELIPLIVGR